MAAPVTHFTTTRYRCPTCRKTGSSRIEMQRHADNCAHAPESRACITCAFNEPQRVQVAPNAFRTVFVCDRGALPADKRLVLHCSVWEAAR
ncbi:hypothetical protein J2847_002937 [Azospirillum agricola]|uniref:hypothetical protein n=1 Tax=Azospirillum agricola TaxID=1720247 RepID=UPI001AE8D170|nr:hypothetical protein [Azospirillum agricola]MBP2229638.1 hypothetical protein [Azospirillum agricola]